MSSPPDETWARTVLTGLPFFLWTSLHGSMRQRDDVPFLFDVTTQVAAPKVEATDATEAAAGGPAQVATDSYRKGWDAIWGRRPRSPHLN